MHMQQMNTHKHGFLQNGRYNSYQTYRYDSLCITNGRVIGTVRKTNKLFTFTKSSLQQYIAIPTWSDWFGSQDKWMGNVEKSIQQMRANKKRLRLSELLVVSWMSTVEG